MASQTTSNDSSPLDKVLFNPLAAWVGAICLVLSLILPPDGLGITICWFKWWFDLPCPGCGLTRSVTCISHLQFAKALAYHPFGPVVYGIFVFNVAFLSLPQRWTEKIQNAIQRRQHWLRPIYLGVVSTFLLYGGLRLLFNLLPGL